MAHTDEEGGVLNLNFLSHPPTLPADPRASQACFSVAASSTAKRSATERYAKTPNQGFPTSFGSGNMLPTSKVSGDRSRASVTTPGDGEKQVTFGQVYPAPSTVAAALRRPYPVSFTALALDGADGLREEAACSPLDTRPALCAIRAYFSSRTPILYYVASDVTHPEA